MPRVPGELPAQLCEMARDARAAVLLDPEGELAGSSLDDPERSRTLAGLTRELMDAVDATAADAPEQMEAQVDRGAIYLVRAAGWTLAAVARRSALSSLMLYDMRQTLAELER